MESREGAEQLGAVSASGYFFDREASSASHAAPNRKGPLRGLQNLGAENAAPDLYIEPKILK